jgi:alpha/beta superfamily hydrolase
MTQRQLDCTFQSPVLRSGSSSVWREAILTLESIKETAVEFQGPAGRIEARLGAGPNKHGRALVVLHPHPRYGGNMNNNVVETIVRAGQASGFITLRFNFRGVNSSEGCYGDGPGEQDDVAAGLAFLRENFSPTTRILAGYSFGACVGLAFCHRTQPGVDHLILVSPPPFLLSKDLTLDLPVVKRILIGKNDEVAPVEEVRSGVSEQKREALIRVIPGADHFFQGQEEMLEILLQEALLDAAGD